MLVLIAGITGSLGQRLANVAISKGLSVRGLGRNPNNLSPKLSRKLESFIKSDSYYDIQALEKAVTGVDAVINAYAPHPVLDLDGHLLLPRAAERG
jgi:putative NADH-flavin reductase